MASIKMYAGQPKGVETRFFSLALTSTTATAVAKLPRGARIISFVLVGTPSDDSGTGTVSIGTTTTANEYVSAQSVKSTGGTGPTLLATVAGTIGQSPLSADQVIYAKYTGQNSDATTGAWTVFILHTLGETKR